MSTKKVTITLTPEHQEKAKKASKKLFGLENLSGYIQVLIEKDTEEKKCVCKAHWCKLNKSDFCIANDWDCEDRVR